MKRKILSNAPLVLAIIAVAFLIAAGARNGSDQYIILVVIGTVLILVSAIAFIALYRAGYFLDKK